MREKKVWRIWIFCAAAFLTGNAVAKAEENSVEEGVAYIESLEAKSTTEIEEKIREIKKGKTNGNGKRRIISVGSVL